MSKTEWKECTLGSVCDLVAGYAFKSADFGDFNSKVIKITHITPPRVDEASLAGVDISKYDASKLGKYVVQSGDYVFAMTGATIGKIGRLYKGEAYINQRVLTFRNKESIINKDFLYYVLLKDEFAKYVYNHIDSESAQPNISANTVAKYTFDLPPIEKQKEIAKILSSLDDKIELNNAINRNLEEQAQAIFKSWFVDFEPFGGEMPSNWTIGKLPNIADITMGQSPDGKSYNENGNGVVFYQGRAEFGWRFPTRRLFTTAPGRMAKKYDTLMSVRAPVGDLNIANEDCCIGRGLAAIHSKDNHQSFVHYTITALKPKLDMYNGEGTVFGCINRDSLSNMEVIIPCKQNLDKFESLISALDAEIFYRSEENRRLMILRDTLLPKLMSGEMELSC
ncbi:MAG: restriction endonuclease subunit S [Fibrobacteraceae bacterium]|nr:restriction endonuclease subunit S [Fibrobacteraceae bacterium]